MDRKVIFLGDVGVGKSSIISRLMYNTMEGTYSPTVGIDYLSKTVYKNNQVLKIHFWDTAGQEKFKSLMPSYIRYCSVAVIVYDVSSSLSFNNVKIWTEMVNEESPSIEIIVVGNKTDMTRDVSGEDALKLAHEVHAGYVECSAKTGQGIDLVYNKVFQVLPEVLNRKKGTSLSFTMKGTKNCGCL